MTITVTSKIGLDVNSSVRLEKETRKVGNKNVTYALFVFIDGDGKNQFALSAADGDDTYISPVENYFDARQLFKLLVEGDVDAVTLCDIVDDFYLEKHSDSSISCDLTA